MSEQDIIPLTKVRVPTILSYDNELQSYVIGDKARLTGLKGKTTVFNFKPDLGKGDAEFSKKKNFWYYLAPNIEFDQRIETFTAKEATTHFLRELLKDTLIPEQIIIGEPAIRDKAWKDNFRRHVREVFDELEYSTQPLFFPEPFAVFQYYRNSVFPKASKSELVLIVDIGGGTFNSCIIKTTDQGYLARGGATSLPLGLQAELCGGSEIDKELLKIVVKKAKQNGVIWKEDPIRRAEHGDKTVFLHIEDGKIELSQEIGDNARLSEDQSDKQITICLEKGSLHPESEIKVDLNGEDLKGIIRRMWRTKCGPTIIETINEARDKLKSLGFTLDGLDRVLVAGGSSSLPFIKEEIGTVLPTLVDKDHIYIGSDLGTSVAFGIAFECLEQTKRIPELSVGQIAPCVLNELYLGFKKERRTPIIIPKIRHDGAHLKAGKLFSAPFQIDDFILKYELELPFEVKDRVFYCFSDQPLQAPGEIAPLNLNHDVFSLDSGKKFIRKCELEIEIKRDGMIRPSFLFKEKGKGASREGRTVQCPEFYLPNFMLREGNSYVGIDFGTSNSYLVRILSATKEIKSVEFPEFQISKALLDRLRQLEVEIQELKSIGFLTKEEALKYAKDQTLLMVFHSNKIEGNPLTKGETEEAIKRKDFARLSKNQREAANLEKAYCWMIENLRFYQDNPEGFIRTLNKIILDGIISEAGEYRKKAVDIAGMDFSPPHMSSVPAYMEKLAGEIKQGPKERSILEFAATMHTKLVSIHPFLDANGRTARLLMSSILLANDLPAIVINYADKQRYLTTLSECNKGDISSLIDLLLECFHETLEDMKDKFAAGRAPEDESEEDLHETEQPVSQKTEADPIESALEEVGYKSAEDPLASVMESKIESFKKASEDNYEAWRQGFSVLQAELWSIVKEFNSNAQYRTAGYRINFLEFDMLSIDKYLDLCSGRKASKTWFLGLETIGPQSSVRLLFFFGRSPRPFLEKHAISPVLLILARWDGTTYQKLESEPVSLREIGYADGDIVFVDSNRNFIKGNIQRTLRAMLAEVIRSYL